MGFFVGFFAVVENKLYCKQSCFFTVSMCQNSVICCINIFLSLVEHVCMSFALDMDLCA